jgi:hypothetical protein
MEAIPMYVEALLEREAESISILKRSSSFLLFIIKYVRDDIKKRVTLILDIWEPKTNSTSISTRISNLKEYLQKELENYEHFSKKLSTPSLVEYQVLTCPKKGTKTPIESLT